MNIVNTVLLHKNLFKISTPDAKLESEMFVCDKCGLCCMKVGSSSIYYSLDRGDGVCKYFDISSKLCTRYNDRPLLCNIDEMYKAYFKDKMSKEEYYNLNYDVCNQFKQKQKG